MNLPRKTPLRRRPGKRRMEQATDLRKEARGRDCQVRSPVCTGNPEETVLAHVRLQGISGMGLKSPDLLGAHSCAACHQLADTGEYNGTRMERDDRELLILRGMARTIAGLVREGKVTW